MSLDEGWKTTVNAAINDPKWDAYDSVLTGEINLYVSKFGKSPGFSAPSLELLKAMLWTESGGPANSVWMTRPLQIGNPKDPAYAVLSSGAEGSDLIMSDALRQQIKAPELINTPSVNIGAGVAYLMTRHSISEFRSVRDAADSKTYEYVVKAGDNFSVIADRVKTTVDELRSSNPGIVPASLQVGQKLKYRKASIKRVITGWRKFTAANAAKYYNGGGDEFYEEKLNYILFNVLPKLKRVKR